MRELGLRVAAGGTQSVSPPRRSMAGNRPRHRICSRLVWAALAAVIALVALPDSGFAYSPELRRYPYLTDVVGTSATVNWGTTRAATTGVVKYGKVGTESCTAHTVSASKTSITVGLEAQYQWKGRLTVSPDTEYCYRVYLGGSSGIDLLDSDPSPQFLSQLPAGSSEPFAFAVFGNWGEVDETGANPQQANLMQQLATSGARFAVTTGDNAYNSGNQTNYGDLVQTGLETSGVFGPSFWKVPGASMPIFPALGNHGISTANTHFLNWPQTTAVSSSGGRYQNDTYCCLNGTLSTVYGSAWYAFDAGIARFYVLQSSWGDLNVGTASDYQNDHDYHWTPNSPEYQWLQNDLATHPTPLKFAFFQYPIYSDNKKKFSDTFLQGPDSLEGLLSRYGVDVGFSGHAHMYERNLKPHADSLVTYITGGGGAKLMPIGEEGCSSWDAYGLGWSNSANNGLGRGSACGSAPIPNTKDEIFHFLLVSVSDTGITVTPVDSQGRTFDAVTYPVPVGEADLSLTKSDAPDAALVRRTVTYTLSVRNGGPSPASGVIVTDKLPAGVDFESATSSQGSCAESAGTVTCKLGELASDDGATVEVNVRPTDAGTITNTASVVGDDSRDPDSANNTDSEDTTVVHGADLSLTKSDAPDPALAGEALTYTLSVNNNGRDDATGVTVTDHLPAGATFEAATPSQGTCAEADGTLTCELGVLASEASASVEVKVTPQRPGRLMNEAAVRGDQLDPDTDNNRAGEETIVGPLADLSLTKSDGADPTLFGDSVTYTLAVRNDGPADARGVVVTDNLPAEASFEQAVASQGTCSESSGTVSCDLGELANGASATIEIKAKPQRTGTLTNTARVTADDSSYDVDSANNTDSEETRVAPAADLSISKSGSPDPVLLGETLTYSISVGNGGPSDATGVTVTDDLPAGVTYRSATPSQGSCSESGGRVTCALGTVTNGGDATVELKVSPQREGTITNTARVVSEAVDSNSSNDSASVETTVISSSDLSLTKSDSSDPVNIGQNLLYTLSIRNNGPSTATGVTVTDTLPATASFRFAFSFAGSCLQTIPGTVRCTLGTLSSGASATVYIWVIPQAAGPISNTASVQADQSDPNTANNSETEVTTVNAPPADLSISGTDSPDPVRVGQTLTYSLSVRNNGPSSSNGTTVTDTLPAGVAYQSATSSQGSCSQADGIVTCNLGSLSSGNTATVTVRVTPQSTGTITNRATVQGAQPDSNSGNNTATNTTTVTSSADLSLTITDSPDPIVRRQTITYTLTIRNAGPSQASGVSVQNRVPNGVSYESSSASQGTCSLVSGWVRCSLGSLAASGSATVTIRVVPSSQGTVTNSASVSASEPDPSSGNNSASAQTTVTRR